MFEEGRLYSPVTRHEDGTVEVHLSDNHPGRNDPAYMARRGEIAGAALSWTRGEPIPVIDYTDAEHEIWRTVSAEPRAEAREVRAQRVPHRQARPAAAD